MGTPEERFWPKVNKTEGCWEWTACIRNGYGAFGVKKNEVLNAHRYSWILSYGEIPEGLLVCHHCDNRICVRPDHLFLGTHYDNTHDGIVKGRIQPLKGFKLTKPQVRFIKEELLPMGVPLSEIAKIYDVTYSMIWCIAKRKAWWWV